MKKELEKQLEKDARFELQQISVDEWGGIKYFEPIIYFDDLTEYNNIVKKHFSKTDKYLQLTEYFNNPDLPSSEYFNDINYFCDDSFNLLSGENLEKLKNTLKSIYE
tara:strand:- start:2916 stop:3236 length:321 start_codon:yes stop_codon:yes gene_type:complete